MSTSFTDSVAQMIFEGVSSMGGELGRDAIAGLLEKPKSREHGDLAFPCFVLAKAFRSAPQKIAEQLESSVVSAVQSSAAVAAVKAVGPFLNFRISVPFLAETLITEVTKGDFLGKREGQSERVMIEYSQPNTHKAFHVGHLRCASLGDTLRRLKEWQGYDVIPVNYLGDEGTHVARCLWYYKNQNNLEVPETGKGEFLGKLYVEATRLLDLSELSDAPIKGVIAARVLEVTEHSSEEKWKVIKLDTGSQTQTVVTAIKNITPDTIVAWAAPGAKIGGRAVGVVDKKGTTSTGMVCSPQELGLGEDNDSVYQFPEQTQVGKQIADLFAKDGCDSPTEIIKQREAEVSAVLQAIESQEGPAYELWKETKQWSLNEFHEIYEWLDCKFDRFFFESECGEDGKRLTREYQAKGVFEESDGAVGANLRDEKLGFCILIKSDGTATYACRDIALAQTKFEDYKVDQSLYVVDSGQTLHFQQVFACLKRMGYEQAEKCNHFGYALVVRPEGKMSSRKGNVVLFSQLKDMLYQRIYSEFLESYAGDWPQEEIDHAKHILALATMRYGMLKQDNNSTIIFDLDEWASRSGNTGPYLLYAYARISSILRDAGEVDSSSVNFAEITHESEANLLVHLSEYHSVLERAAENCAPHFLTSFLYESCKLFNGFYRDCSVLKAETSELRASRVQLVSAVGEILKHGLGVLGIKTLSRM